jgi:N-acyl-D-amino-acid deacylase
MSRLSVAAATVAGLLSTVPLRGELAGQQPPERFDIVLLGGRVIDGTGNPWFYADVGIRGGKIVAVGDLSAATAARTIDVRRRYVTPGFVDLHSHAGDHPTRNLMSDDVRYRVAPNLVVQGLTTLVTNQDGSGPWPIKDQRASMERKGIGPNAILLVGHGLVRDLVMKKDYQRIATADEIKQMQALVRQGMKEGAFGLSAGHEYTPMRWANTEEIIALVQEVKPWHGVYIVHERASGAQPMWWWPSQDPPGQPSMLDAALETIRVAEATGVTSVQTHIKVRGVDYWGSSVPIIQAIDRARRRGVPIWADQYTYNTTGSDGATVLIPPRVLDRAAAARQGGRPDYAAALRTLLADSGSARLVRMDIEFEISRRGGQENLLVIDYPNRALVGKTLAEIAADWKASPVETAIQLQLQGDPNLAGGVRLRGFSLSELDVENFMRQPWVATSTDAGIALRGDGFIHPRFYGTYPRKIHEYVQKRGVIDLEFAIRSMSSLPAQILGLRDRGQVREGFWADLVVFDPEHIEDRATALEPFNEPTGIEQVLVNGKLVVDNGKLTNALPGKVLTPLRSSSAVSLP